MPVDLVVPEVGESITEVEIGKWLVGEGDAVEKDQPLVEIETDKVTLELPAPAAGTISKITHQQGAEAAVGDKIGEMEEGGGSGAAGGGAKKQQQAGGGEGESDSAGGAATEEQTKPRQPEKQQDNEQQDEPQDKPADTGDRGRGDEPRVMPAAQRLLDEHGLDAAQVTPTGPGGRVLKEDVQNYLDQHQDGQPAKATPSAEPSGNGKPADAAPTKTATSTEPLPEGAVPPPAFADRDTSDQAATSKPQPSRAGGASGGTSGGGGERGEEVVPMTPLRKRIASRLVEAQQTAALLTTFNECDMTEVMSLRSRYKDAFEKKYGIKLGFMSFFVKAVVDALLQYPQVGAEVRGTDIVFKNFIDIGIAVGTGKGLVVPVLRDADQKSFAEIENTIVDFGKRAQAGKLALDELQGGTFTITNGGVFGSMLSTPIINPPQSAVLGMHNIQRRPIAVGTPGKDERIEIRPMMYLALSYDHRLIDGREAVTFLKRIKDTIEEPTRMLMEV